MLVSYAGRDDDHAPNPKQEYAYSRFLSGADTLQIAKHYRMSEATALRWITTERCWRLGLPNPYGRRP